MSDLENKNIATPSHWASLEKAHHDAKALLNKHPDCPNCGGTTTNDPEDDNVNDRDQVYATYRCVNGCNTVVIATYAVIAAEVFEEA